MNVDRPKRTWPLSLAVALSIVGVGIVLSAVVNPMLGRYVHWDWMAGVAPAATILLTIAIRRRWI